MFNEKQGNLYDFKDQSHNRRHFQEAYCGKGGSARNGEFLCGGRTPSVGHSAPTRLSIDHLVNLISGTVIAITEGEAGDSTPRLEGG